jgi:16S rRNA (guanine966-N2)-methyltransferase
MRIISGEFRSRTVIAPDSEKTRPTTDRARESLFNVLSNLFDFDEARVLDLFAGSGALGIEALSRGAAHCTFVEKDHKALESLRKNISALAIEARCTVSATDVYSFVRSAEMNWHVILSDAPYDDIRARTELPTDLLRFVTPGGVVVMEHRTGDAVVVPVAADIVRELKAGEASFTILRHKS